MAIWSKTSSASLRDLRNQGWRVVCTKRKRKLVKRGEFVYWNVHHSCWLWESNITLAR